MTVDREQVTILGLLDLSAAVVAVDHIILIYRLRHSFEIQGVALSWIESLVSKRTLTVSFLAVSHQLNLQHVVYLNGVFSVLCFSCCIRPTYSPLPVVMALAHVPTPMTQLYHHTPADLCRHRLSRGVVHRLVEQMDMQQSA